MTDVETAKTAGVEAKDGFPADGSVSVGNSTLRMRSWPWGDVLSTYRTGASVKVLGVSGEFYLVEVDGQQGYMHKNYVSIPARRLRAMSLTIRVILPVVARFL